eukprot:403348644
MLFSFQSHNQPHDDGEHLKTPEDTQRQIQDGQEIQQNLDLQELYQSNTQVLASFPQFLESYDLLDKGGRSRMEQLIDQNQDKLFHMTGKGQESSLQSPNDSIITNEQQESIRLPRETVKFAQNMLKSFLLSMTEKEADYQLEDHILMTQNNGNNPNSGSGQKDSSGGKSRRRRQERLTEINNLIKKKSYSPDNSILANIKQLDEQYQKIPKPSILRKKQVKSRQEDTSPQSLNSRDEQQFLNQLEASNSNQEGRNRYFSEYVPNQSQLKNYMAQTQFCPQPRDLQRELSSIIDDQSTIMQNQNSTSFLSKNHNHYGLLQGVNPPSSVKNLKVDNQFQVPKNMGLGRYQSKELLEKGYDSLGSGYTSQERLQTDGFSMNTSNKNQMKSTQHLQSMASLTEFFDDPNQKNGQNRINLREFREKMIQNGFKRPQFFVRVDQGSPKPVSKLHERLYQEQKQKNKVIEQKRMIQEKEKLKECTFAPQINKEVKYLKRKQARSPNPADVRRHQINQLIPEEATQILTTSNQNNDSQLNVDRNLYSGSSFHNNPSQTQKMKSIQGDRRMGSGQMSNVTGQNNAFQRLYNDNGKKEQNIQKIREEVMNEKKKDYTFNPNRDLTKQSDNKFAAKRSPDRVVQGNRQNYASPTSKQKQFQPVNQTRNIQLNSQNSISSPNNATPQQTQAISNLKQQQQSYKGQGSLLQKAINHQSNQMKDQSLMESILDTPPKPVSMKSPPQQHPQPEILMTPTQDSEIKQQKLMEFEKRNADFLKRKEEKLRNLQEIQKQELNFMPKLYAKRRSLDSRNPKSTPEKQKTITDSTQFSPQRAAGERLYEQGRQLLILKDEFSRIQQNQQLENQGKPDINKNTYKILELKTKRTGESYIAPSERQNSGSRILQNSSRSYGQGRSFDKNLASDISVQEQVNDVGQQKNYQAHKTHDAGRVSQSQMDKINHTSNAQSMQLFSFHGDDQSDNVQGNIKGMSDMQLYNILTPDNERVTDNCPFSINDGASEAPSNFQMQQEIKFNNPLTQSNQTYDTLQELRSLRDSHEKDFKKVAGSQRIQNNTTQSLIQGNGQEEIAYASVRDSTHTRKQL